MPTEQVAISEIQSTLPWEIEYSKEFQESQVAHKEFQHALTHIFKSAGRLAALVESGDHVNNSPEWHYYCDNLEVWDTQDWIADMVICAMRMANVCPSGKFDLGAAVISRISTRNNVELIDGRWVTK